MLEERKQKVPKTPKKHESYLFYPFIRPEEMLAQARGGTLVHWCNRINSCEAQLYIFLLIKDIDAEVVVTGHVDNSSEVSS